MGCFLASIAAAQTSTPTSPPAAASPPVAQRTKPAASPPAAKGTKPAPSSLAAKRTKTSPYHGMKVSEKAKIFYPAAWGVDQLSVNYTSSGNLIRFNYRVVEPKLAKALGDHEATPYLYAPRTHAMLQVPTMEKIGQLRQMSAAEANKTYWMVFSNKGNLVQRGDRVNVIIGKFHADGLLVE